MQDSPGNSISKVIGFAEPLTTNATTAATIRARTTKLTEGWRAENNPSWYARWKQRIVLSHSK
jgi:hypothetical protein